MDLKGILPKKEKAPEFYWSLLIEPGWVQAGLWRVQQKQVEVLATSPPHAWELDSELIKAVDSAISSSKADSVSVEKPSKTVFGLTPSWVEGGEIKDKYLGKIKNVCEELSLEPSGFVVVAEAISHLIKSEEGSPISAVLIGVYEKNLDISVFRNGKFKGETQVSRSVSVADDLIEGFTRLGTKDPFPSRLILYDGREGELAEVRQNLLNVSWDETKRIEFLHQPKIEAISSGKKVDAVSLAGASEISDAVSLATPSKNLAEEAKVDTKDDSKLLENIDPEVSDVSPEELGFVLGKDVKMSEDEGDTKEDKTITNRKIEEDKTTARVKKRGRFPIKIKEMFAKFKDRVISIVPKKKKKEISEEDGSGKRALVTGIIVFLLLIVGGFAAWWYLPKATVTLYVTTKSLEERIEIAVDPEAGESDLEEGILAGELEKVEVEGERTKSTTGTRTVGEKAKGEVVLYRVGPELSLDSGTSVTGINGLEFTIDNDVIVASGSAGSPGTTTAEVTASDIGAEYNLAAGNNFSISNYSTSDIEAKNEESFSGGTSREISAVSEDDVKELEEALTEELTENAKEKLKDSLESNRYLIDESISTKIISNDFSNKVGDEASTLKLELVLEGQALIIDKDTMLEFGVNELSDRVPEGFVLRKQQVEVDFKFEEEDEGIYQFELAVRANLLPEIRPNEVADMIRAKYPALARKYLTENVPGFVRADIDFRPKLPGRLGSLPRVAKNISVEVAADK